MTYTGRFTSWFGGNLNGYTAVFTGTFSVRGTGDDGSRVTGNFTSHVTFVDGEPVVEFEKGHIRGCAADDPRRRSQGPGRDLRERLILG